MKPGDHPDFFRSLAPFGASRESTIVLSREGEFFHDGKRIDHPRVRRAFSRWLGRHPDDGRFILSNGYDWTYLTVEGTPYFVETARCVGSPVERVLLLLSDESEEPLDPDTVGIDPQGVVHCMLLCGERARFSRQAQLELAPALTQGEHGAIVLAVGGKRVTLPESLDCLPGPSLSDDAP